MVPEVNSHSALRVLGIVVGLAACAELSSTSSPDTPDQSDEQLESRPASGAGGAADQDSVSVRKPTLAGSWYPKERSLLVAEIQRMLYRRSLWRWCFRTLAGAMRAKPWWLG
jgi:hypothetical protein